MNEEEEKEKKEENGISLLQQFMQERKREEKERRIEELREKPFSLRTNNHSKYNNLFLFKYSQTRSSFRNLIVQEARGIILDEKDNWKPVCFPYKKFFNYGEPNAAPIDWPSAFVTEKLDGSLMNLYYYKGNWEVSTTGMADGNGPATGGQKTFRELFFEVWKEKKYLFPSGDDRNKCYMFELMTELNQIIVLNSQRLLVLHGVRDMRTLKEERVEKYGEKYGWELPKFYHFESLEEVKKESKNLNGREQEGFVVCDQYFNRIKVKAPHYVDISHGVSSSTLFSSSSSSSVKVKVKKGKERDGGVVKRRDEDFVKILQLAEEDEFIANHPEAKQKMENLKRQYTHLGRDLEQHFLIYQKTSQKKGKKKERKRERKEIDDEWYAGCMYKLLSGEISTPFDWLEKQPPSVVSQALKEKERRREREREREKEKEKEREREERKKEREKKGREKEKEKEKEFRCLLCECICTDQTTLRDHLKGKKHQKKVLEQKEKGKEKGKEKRKEKEKEERIEASENHTKQEEEEEGKKKDFICDLCNVVCLDKGAFNGHLEGKRHQNRASQLSSYCDVCSVQCSDPTLFRLHLGGKKHLGRIAQKERERERQKERESEIEKEL